MSFPSSADIGPDGLRHPAGRGPVRIAVPDVLVDLNLPQVREVAAQLRFSPTEGSIWLADQRMVLLQAEAFSALREELIASLGMDTARGLLTRIGYATGCRDAQMALRLMGTSRFPQDVGRTGAILHSLQGFALPEGLLDPDPASWGSSDYYAEWIWRNSVEDAGHVAHHGIGGAAACWTEVGYSSGYLSTVRGQRILVREVECRALGHAQCRNIAKPVASWQDAEDDLRFLEPQAPPPAQVFVRRGPTRPAGEREHAALPVWDDDEGLIGASTAHHVMCHKLYRVAPTLASVLLLGESGVGKSLVAREVHRRSQRAQGKFIEINCAAIPEALVESELFGVERGAYSGAVASRPGRFEAADGGTIFLDEIGTLSLSAQAKLLRVLQSGELERLGSNRTLRTDVRVIAATNEDLAVAVKEGRFREDLYYRLRVFPIVIQPLRERREDIPLLTGRLLARSARRHGCAVSGISTKAMQALLDHAWPGNIRELENVIERGVILAGEGELLDAHHLFSIDDVLSTAPMLLPGEGGKLSVPGRMQAQPTGSPPVPGSASIDDIAAALLDRGPVSLAAVESALVRAAMAKSRGVISHAAGLLGVTRAQAEYRVRKLGLQDVPRRPTP